MNISAVICEYNPFHNGHKYMLDEMKRSGSDCIIACMSGNFTQRGEPAVLDKNIRAAAAVQNGADLVIELPVTYACSGAERFAMGGVYILDKCGCADRLCFGSEEGSLDVLVKAAAAEKDPLTAAKIKEYLKDGRTFASAREAAMRDIIGGSADILKQPNNILGVEYIKALASLGSSMEPFTIKRKGSAHDSENPEGDTASASFIRKLMRDGEDYSKYVPQSEKQVSGIVDMNALEGAVLYRLKTMFREEYSALPDMSEGLENRLYNAARDGNSVEEIMMAAKCKRYTLARIRRAVMHSFLRLTEKDFELKPQYIRVMGFSETGREALKLMKKTARLPIVTRQSDVMKLSGEGRYLIELERRCDRIYSLFSGGA